MRTVSWSDGKVILINQLSIPWEFETVMITTHHEMAAAIENMIVRGAPAIGAAAAFGFVLALENYLPSDGAFDHYLLEARTTLNNARPTAVNLSWAVERVARAIDDIPITSYETIFSKALAEAQQIADEDIAINRRMGEFGATLIQDGMTILHHCNTGSLATVEWGTALGVIRTAHAQGKKLHVLLDETRPRLQGARLSAWELANEGISFEVIADNAAGYFMRRGEVNIVLVGSDRTARNGDVANKIGTYQIAVLAKENGIPFYPVVPTSTIDLSAASGDTIPIEERDPDEIRKIAGNPIIPENYPVRNPAFDVTPHRYVTGIITEQGIAYPPFEISLPAMVTKSLNTKGLS